MDETLRAIIAGITGLALAACSGATSAKDIVNADKNGDGEISLTEAYQSVEELGGETFMLGLWKVEVKFHDGETRDLDFCVTENKMPEFAGEGLLFNPSGFLRGRDGNDAQIIELTARDGNFQLLATKTDYGEISTMTVEATYSETEIRSRMTVKSGQFERSVIWSGERVGDC